MSKRDYTGISRIQHEEGRSEARRQVAESLAFMRLQSLGMSYAQAMKEAKREVDQRFAAR